MVRSLENWEEVPTKGFPIIFHGVVGKDQQEKRSPSFFNPDEAILVSKYCLSLVNDRKKGVRTCHGSSNTKAIAECGIGAQDIGVITPYHGQRIKIKQLLDKNPKLEDITVGSVEQFQGQVSIHSIILAYMIIEPLSHRKDVLSLCLLSEVMSTMSQLTYADHSGLLLTDVASMVWLLFF